MHGSPCPWMQLTFSKLSQTMLGDNPEKSRNPLKKAMRRRNAKTVTFSEPTYYEASEQEYSSDSEDEDEMDYRGDDDRDDGQAQRQQQEQQQQQQQQAQNEPARVEPLNIVRSTPQKTSPIESAMEDIRHQDSSAEDKLRTSSEVLESQHGKNNLYDCLILRWLTLSQIPTNHGLKRILVEIHSTRMTPSRPRRSL
jgi:hypothetical protein